MSATKLATTLAIEPTKDINRFRDFFATRKDLGGFMDPRLIRIDKGHNPRDYKLPENRAHLDSLKISIAAAGVRQPLLCRLDAGQCILVDGESRLTAVLELIHEGTDIKLVPVMQVKADDEGDRIAIAVGANTGKPLSEWELGGAFKRLEKLGWTHEDMGGNFGISTQKVAKCIELADMPQDVKQLLSERAITPALAITTIRRSKKTGGAGVAGATDELKDAAAKAKATGKKTAKAAKAPTKKEVAAGEWEKIARAIYSGATEEWTQSNAEGAEKFDWINVRYIHFKKLAALVEGTK